MLRSCEAVPTPEMTTHIPELSEPQTGGNGSERSQELSTATAPGRHFKETHRVRNFRNHGSPRMRSFSEGCMQPWCIHSSAVSENSRPPMVLGEVAFAEQEFGHRTKLSSKELPLYESNFGRANRRKREGQEEEGFKRHEPAKVKESSQGQRIVLARQILL